MAVDPDSSVLVDHKSQNPAGNNTVKKPFTIKTFLWENFRLFTMVGITGTMISLIPNMGERVLGPAWITGTDTFLPLFLSVIIFFGALFLSICFLLIFSLVLANRADENVRYRIGTGPRALVWWYEGDSQRMVLLFVLVPMWLGLLMFFLLLMPLVPNRFSWLFAAVFGLTVLPLAAYVFIGWVAGRMVAGSVPGLAKSRVTIAAITFMIVAVFLAAPYVFPDILGNTEDFSGDIRIKTDPQYFSPQTSTAKGLRLEITNLSGRSLLDSCQTWNADYGYFVRVIPSTSEVTILGNPVSAENGGYIYWTYPRDEIDRVKQPVKISVRVSPREGNGTLAGSTLWLTWYTKDIAFVNRSYIPE